MNAFSPRSGTFRLRSLLLILIVLSLIGATNFAFQSYQAGNQAHAGEMTEETQPPPLFSQEELAFYDASFREHLQQSRFNGTALVARNGIILYQEHFGYADFRSQTDLDLETPFQLASITKTFTAAAILLLQEERMLHIDDPVAAHIEGFPYPDMTIRHFLNHTSGIQNYMYMVERYWQHEYPPTNEDVLNLFIRHQPGRNFRAGTRFGYSNTGYAFLALLVERVSGLPFPEFVHQRIFEPLGMNNTFVYNPHTQHPLAATSALGFRAGRRSFIANGDVVHDGVFGDKGIYSTVIDLFIWDRSICEGKLLSEEKWAQAFEPATLQNGRTVNYGQGWRLQSFLDKKVVHHPGRWNGFRTSFKRFVDDDATLILLSNNSRDITPIINGMQNILFHKEIQLLAEQPVEEEQSDEYQVGGDLDPSLN
jgi:CubicO group peptidase (beta-lactamase class C family)